MKTHLPLSLAALALAGLAASAPASDSSWQAIDHQHGARTYLPGRVKTEPATIALAGHALATRPKAPAVQRARPASRMTALTVHTVFTPHGSVIYLASAD